MIKIRQEGRKIFISFKYDIKKVERVKTLPNRKYDPSTREWVIDSRHIRAVLNVFQDYEVQIDDSVSKNVKKAVENNVYFEKVDGRDFKFKTSPYDHQIEGFEYGIQHNKFLLGDQQGLGKTKQAIDIAIARKHQFKHCLIVCGVNALKWNWLEEIQIHSDETGHLIGGQWKNKKGGNKVLRDGSLKQRLEDLKNIDNVDNYFLVTNIETLRNKDIQNQFEKLTQEGIIGMTIIDEIHQAKNPQSKQGKGIHKLQSFYKMALTGTPLINKPMDLYNILKWLDVEYNAFYKFKNRYCIMGGYGGHEIIAYRNLAELQNKLNNVMLRRLKTDVLDLPEKVHITEYVEMGAKQKKIYSEVLQAVRSNIDLIKISPNPLAQLIRLRQATGYTGILSSEIKESAKIDRLKELITEIVDNGEKAIIFSNWTNVTDPVVDVLQQYNPAIITGAVKDKMTQVHKFQEDDSCKVIIGTIGAMGTGLTLTAATNVIFLDSPWSAAIKEQAEDRAHRIGTKGTVNVITLVTKDTIDEKIEDIVNRKGALSGVLVDKEVEIDNKAFLIDYLLS